MIISRGHMMITWCENVKMHEYTLCFVFDKIAKFLKFHFFMANRKVYFLIEGIQFPCQSKYPSNEHLWSELQS